jgi:basic amino acid/polyamine antiporter, APA family
VMTVAAVIVLRRTQPDRPRPYRCYGYPWLPLLYIVIGIGFVLSTLIARPRESLTGLGLAALGIPLYLHWRRQRGAAQTETPEHPMLERAQGGVNHEPE